MKNAILAYFLVCKGRSNDDVGGTRGTGVQEIRPVAGSEPAISLKKSRGGYRRTTVGKAGDNFWRKGEGSGI